jgi:hypothetical protein
MATQAQLQNEVELLRSELEIMTGSRDELWETNSELGKENRRLHKQLSAAAAVVDAAREVSLHRHQDRPLGIAIRAYDAAKEPPDER